MNGVVVDAEGEAADGAGLAIAVRQLFVNEHTESPVRYQGRLVRSLTHYVTNEWSSDRGAWGVLPTGLGLRVEIETGEEV